MTQWTDDFLDPKRNIGDPPADALIARFFAENEIDRVNSLMRGIVRDNILPPDLAEFLEQVAVPPTWADPAKIRLGEQLFWRLGVPMIAALLCEGLPFCYAGSKGVQVLALTTRLYTNPTRRIIETAQMVVDVMSPGGLSPGGIGLRTAQKVRLMHAGVRFQIARSGCWNSDWGAPVNQEDLAGTLIAFSWIALDALQKLGLSYSPEEAEAFLHCWNVVGHVLGIQDDLLPQSESAAAALAAAIARRQFAASPEGQQLEAALLEMMQHIVPGNVFDFVPAALTRFLLGDATADLLAIRHFPLTRELFLPLRLCNLIAEEVLEHPAPLAKIAVLFSRKLIESFQFVSRGGSRPAFGIPTQLRETWGLNWTC